MLMDYLTVTPGLVSFGSYAGSYCITTGYSIGGYLTGSPYVRWETCGLV